MNYSELFETTSSGSEYNFETDIGYKRSSVVSRHILNSLPLYPLVIVYPEWQETHDPPKNSAPRSIYRKFSIKLMFEKRESTGFYFTFKIGPEGLTGEKDYTATVIDRNTCRFQLYDYLKNFSVYGQEFFSDFYALAPIDTWRFKLKTKSLFTCFSLNGNRYIAALETAEILLATKKKNVIKTKLFHSGHRKRIVKLVLFANGSKAVSISNDAESRIFDLSKFSCISVLRGHTREITDCQVIGDGLALVTASKDCTAKIWDLNSKRLLRTIVINAPVNSVKIADIKVYRAAALDYRQNDSLLTALEGSLGVFCCDSGSVFSYNLSLESSIDPFFELIYSSSAVSIEFLCPELLAVGYDSGIVIVWNVISKQKSRSIDVGSLSIANLKRLGASHMAIISKTGYTSVLSTTAEVGLPLEIVPTNTANSIPGSIQYIDEEHTFVMCCKEGYVRKYRIRKEPN